MGQRDKLPPPLVDWWHSAT